MYKAPLARTRQGVSVLSPELTHKPIPQRRMAQSTPEALDPNRCVVMDGLREPITTTSASSSPILIDLYAKTRLNDAHPALPTATPAAAANRMKFNPQTQPSPPINQQTPHT